MSTKEAYEAINREIEKYYCKLILPMAKSN